VLPCRLCLNTEKQKKKKKKKKNLKRLKRKVEGEFLGNNPELV
jgi:hypothetical protein